MKTVFTQDRGVARTGLRSMLGHSYPMERRVWQRSASRRASGTTAQALA